MNPALAFAVGFFVGVVAASFYLVFTAREWDEWK